MKSWNSTSVLGTQKGLNAYGWQCPPGCCESSWWDGGHAWHCTCPRGQHWSDLPSTLHQGRQSYTCQYPRNIHSPVFQPQFRNSHPWIGQLLPSQAGQVCSSRSSAPHHRRSRPLAKLTLVNSYHNMHGLLCKILPITASSRLGGTKWSPYVPVQNKRSKKNEKKKEKKKRVEKKNSI